MKKKIDLKTLFILLTFAVIGGFVFAFSGIYDIAARFPHQKQVRLLLLATKRRSVEFQARNLKVPELNTEELIKRGLILYQMNCLACHGAPGIRKSRIGIGLNPNPPPLEKAVVQWKTREIAWMISNGIKMAGMPAFGIGKESQELWALTAFVVRMNTISPSEYQQMIASLRGEQKDVQWQSSSNGWGRLKAANKEKGKKLLTYYGCTSCHTISSIPGPQAQVGPPLDAWKHRHYLAGKLINTPDNLVKWIMDPESVQPGTAMPDLKISEEEALDIAKYLYDF